QKLPRVVPLIDGVSQVDALVALEADQPRAQHVSHHLCRLGLANAGLTLDEERLLELQGQKDRGCEGSIADVVAVAKPLLDVLDGVRRCDGHSQRLRDEWPGAKPGHPFLTAPVRSRAWSAPARGASCIRGWREGRRTGSSRRTHAGAPLLALRRGVGVCFL